MTKRDLLLRGASLLLVLTVSGCAATDADTSPSNDEPTAEEHAAGAAWNGTAPPGEDPPEEAAVDPQGEPTDVADDDALEDKTLESTTDEASAPFFEPDDDTAVDADGVKLPKLEVAELNEIASCRRAAGYRKGKKMSICVTTINGKLVEVNTARAFLRMRKAAKAKGVSIVVVSGFRTMAQQRHLYYCYKSKKCNHGNLAAPPGYSNHQSGHALDLNTSGRGVYSYLARHGSAYHFKRTVPSERWHWEHW